MGKPNSMRILYKTSHLTESLVSLNTMHWLIVSPPPTTKNLTNPKYMISNWPISSKPTLTSPIIYSCTGAGKINFYTFTAYLNKSLAKYSQTLIQHHPHLAHMEVCKQKFPIMWYDNILPSSTSQHKLEWTSSGHILHNIIHVMTKRYIMARWTEI